MPSRTVTLLPSPREVGMSPSTRASNPKGSMGLCPAAHAERRPVAVSPIIRRASVGRRRRGVIVVVL